MEGVRKWLQLLSTHQSTAECLYNKARGFSGVKNGREYLQLEEQLTALLLLVDSVETSGHADIRTTRKHVVHIIQNALSFLGQT